MATLYKDLLRIQATWALWKRGASQFFPTYNQRNVQALNVEPAAPQVRLALPDDFEEVMSMNSQDENFKRQDYMATEYMKYLQDPFLRCLICEDHGRPVVFGIGQFGVDKGSSVIFRSLRGHLDGRGKGYTLHILKTLFDMDPQKRIIGYSARDPSKKLSGAVAYLEHRIEHNLLATESGLIGRGSENRPKNDSVQELSVHEFCDLFNDEQLNGYLYPNKYFVMDTLIAQPMLANKKYFIERTDNIAIFSSRSLLRKGSDKNSNQSEGMISFNTWYPCPSGFINKIELYGQLDTANDFRSHLQAHVRVLQDNGLWGEVKVTVAKDRLTLSDKEMKEVCEDVGLTFCEPSTTERIVSQGNYNLESRLHQSLDKTAL